eukprot:TRINITY_DN4648_c0_g1_i3.p1 TRINITY_DN4648_c0_g1~~TRINITY_DN4648_c0_g1_i3.p1  ORF type:complete len:258 (-),score=22.17 TRINITY_DN4648_c0_g1_i3:78-851(-)
MSLKDLATGLLSSSISKVMTRPFKVLQIAQQTGVVESRYNPVIGASQVVSEFGLLGLFRGGLFDTFRFLPTQVLNIKLKDTINRSLEFLGRGLLKNIISGTVAGAISLTFVYPLDASVVSYTMSNGKKSFIECLFRSNIYSGFAISVIGIPIYRGVYFMLYDIVRELTRNEEGHENPIYFSVYVLSMMVSLVAVFLTYPLDTIRKNQIVHSTSLVNTITEINRQGISAYWSGYGFNIISSLGTFFTLWIYDSLRKNY